MGNNKDQTKQTTGSMPRESSQVGTHGQTGSGSGLQGQGSQNKGQGQYRGQGQPMTHGARRRLERSRAARHAAGRPDRSGPAQRHEPARQGPAAGQPEPTGPAEPLIRHLARQKPLLREGLLLAVRGRPGALPSGPSPARLERERRVEGGIQVGVGRDGLVPAVDEDRVAPRDGHVLARHVAEEDLARHRGRATWPRRRPTRGCRSESDVPGELLRVGPRQLLQRSPDQVDRAPSRARPPPTAVTSTMRSSSSRMKIGGPLAAGSLRRDLDPVVGLELQPYPTSATAPARTTAAPARRRWPPAGSRPSGQTPTVTASNSPDTTRRPR